MQILNLKTLISKYWRHYLLFQVKDYVPLKIQEQNLLFIFDCFFWTSILICGPTGKLYLTLYGITNLFMSWSTGVQESFFIFSFFFPNQCWNQIYNVYQKAKFSPFYDFLKAFEDFSSVFNELNIVFFIDEVLRFTFVMLKTCITLHTMRKGQLIC